MLIKKYKNTLKIPRDTLCLKKVSNQESAGENLKTILKVIDENWSIDLESPFAIAKS